MRVEAISLARCDLWPRRGLVRLSGTLSVRLDDDSFVIVPEGFWSDLASVPNAAWALLDAGPAQLAVMGLVHDLAVRRGATIETPAGPVPFTVEVATDLAVQVALYHGVDAHDRYLIGAALWAAQWSYWQRRDVAWQP